MRDGNLTVPMSRKNAEFLQKLVKVARQASSTVVRVTSCQGSWSGTWEFTISGTYVGPAENFERIEETVDRIPGSPILHLMARGYIWDRDESHVVLNYELAKQRVKYESKNRIGKWRMRVTDNWGRFLLDVAAVLAGIWAVADIIRMVIEALK